jgi:hypothetical protein
MPNYWQQCDHAIHEREKPDPPSYIGEDFMVDIEQKNGQSAKEKKEREMQ